MKLLRPSEIPIGFSLVLTADLRKLEDLAEHYRSLSGLTDRLLIISVDGTEPLESEKQDDSTTD